MKKKKYSPHLSIKRLRELAVEYHRQNYVAKQELVNIIGFLMFVEKNRSSLTSKHVKK